MMTNSSMDSFNKTVRDGINVYEHKNILPSIANRYAPRLTELIKCALELKVKNIVISRGDLSPYMKDTMYFNTYTDDARYYMVYTKQCELESNQDHSGNYSTSYSSQGRKRIYCGKIVSSNTGYAMGMHGFIDNVYLLPSLTTNVPPLITEFNAFFAVCKDEKTKIKLDTYMNEVSCTIIMQPIDTEQMTAETTQYRKELTDMYSAQFRQMTTDFKNALTVVNSEKLAYPDWLIGVNKYSFNIYENANNKKYRSYCYQHTIQVNKISHRSFGVFNVSKVIKPYNVLVRIIVDAKDKFVGISLFELDGYTYFKHPHSTDNGLTGGYRFCLGSFSTELSGKLIKSVDDLNDIQDKINYILADINASDLGAGTSSSMNDVNTFIEQIRDRDKTIQKYLEKTDGWVIKDSKITDNPVTVHDTDENFSGNDMNDGEE